MSKGLKNWFEGLEPDQKQKIVKIGVFAGACLALVLIYYLTGQDKKRPPPPEEEVEVIELGDARLEDDIRAQIEKERQESRAQQAAQAKEIEDQKKALREQEEKLAAMQQAFNLLTDTQGMELPEGDKLTDAPNDPDQWANGGQSRDETLIADTDAVVEEMVPEVIGGIGQSSPASMEAEPAGAGKKKVPRFLLSPGFMPAKVLTGLNAKTVDTAQSNPEPIMLRVQAPAVLPNDVKARLEGCLVVAHGYGDLSSERVEPRLVSLNCIDASGNAVINQEITGTIMDQDGKKGLVGHPVSKMGTNLARLFMAGVVEGGGEAFASQATTTSISPLGQTQSIDSGQIGRAAAGKGTSKAASEYAQIITDIVRQQSPVIEMGPGKDVTVVITEAVWLEVMNLEEGVYER